MTPADEDRIAKWRKKSSGSFLASLLCGILTVIDFNRYASHGFVIIGRENQVLSGWAAQATIGLFAAGTLAFFVYALYLRRRITTFGESARDDEGPIA